MERPMSDANLIQRLDAKLAEFHALDAQLSEPDVASNHQLATDVARRRAALEPVAELYRRYKAAMDEAAGLRKIADQEADAEMRQLAAAEAPELEALAASLMEEIKGELVTGDDRVIGSVILEVRAGVGGDEAALWAGDVVAMYQKYAAEKGWNWDVMETSDGEMGGVKAAIVAVKGPGVWQHLGYEGGTHCVKRVPATETQGRVHTSTATVAVLPEPEDVGVKINEADVKIDFTTSRGPGGQNVNKVATAVKMLHVPTGIEVRMQDTKSQQQNKARAWQLMRARVYEHYQAQANAQRAADRSKMIGSGDRAERIRTYRYKENVAVDHRLNESFNLQEVLAGRLDKIATALIEHDKKQRLAAL
jgi:peptide chain release factor 1